MINNGMESSAPTKKFKVSVEYLMIFGRINVVDVVGKLCDTNSRRAPHMQQ